MKIKFLLFLIILVAMPALLGTLLLFAPLWFLRFANLHWYKLLYLILPTVVFILSLTLVSFIQKSSRQALDVPRKPQGGVAGMIP